jgi:hypothetical protein
MWVVVGIMSTNDGAMDADIGRDGRRAQEQPRG